MRRKKLYNLHRTAYFIWTPFVFNISKSVKFRFSLSSSRIYTVLTCYYATPRCLYQESKIVVGIHTDWSIISHYLGSSTWLEIPKEIQIVPKNDLFCSFDILIAQSFVDLEHQNCNCRITDPVRIVELFTAHLVMNFVFLKKRIS
jgi:hypothetical protein